MNQSHTAPTAAQTENGSDPSRALLEVLEGHKFGREELAAAARWAFRGLALGYPPRAMNEWLRNPDLQRHLRSENFTQP